MNFLVNTMASPGRVLIIVQNLPVPFDRRVWLEATTLQKAGYRVSIISPKGDRKAYSKPYEVLEDVAIYRYPAPPEAWSVPGYVFEFVYCWIMTAFLSLRVLLRRGFDIIHACNPPETYFALALLYKVFGKKFVFDHHDLSPEMYVAKGGSKDGIFYKGLLLLESLTFKVADVVITTNQSHKEIAMQRGGKQEEDIFIVRSGPDLERLKLVDPQPDLRDGKKYLVCYLGEMCEQDGLDYLLESIEHLVHVRGRRDIKFTLIGGGPMVPELNRMKAKLGLEEWVEFTGRVPDLDVQRYLSTADVCVDPDPYTEWANQSTMNKIMEYMAFGKPIVAFDLREHRRSAQDAAVYAKPNSTEEFAGLLESLLDNPEKREDMGVIGLRRVHEELAWRFSQPNLLLAYESVQSK